MVFNTKANERGYNTVYAVESKGSRMRTILTMQSLLCDLKPIQILLSPDPLQASQEKIYEHAQRNYRARMRLFG